MCNLMQSKNKKPRHPLNDPYSRVELDYIILREIANITPFLPIYIHEEGIKTCQYNSVEHQHHH